MQRRTFISTVLSVPVAATLEWLGAPEYTLTVDVPSYPDFYALAGIGTSGVTQGFSAAPFVTGHSSTADRMRRAQNGFVRCVANEERLCFDGSGNFTGQYLQAGDTYLSAPWDDDTAPNTSGDPAYLTGDSGDRVQFAGEHTEADIFGGTGGGVVLDSQAFNQFHTASNISTTVIAGDVIRYQAIVAIEGASEAGRVDIRGAGTNAFGFTFNHDASGVITGFSENWVTYRAGFHDMGTINGKRWWYIWADREMTGSGAVQPGIGFGNIAAQSGKSYHICELMLQKNPASAPAAIPVCKANATFAADRPLTELLGAGFVFDGLALARSQITGGAFEPPAVSIGTPYEPLATRIEMFTSAETVDRAGIMPNRNAALCARPWKTPTDFSILYGPGFFPRDWIIANDSASACTNATIAPVFEAREDLRPILGPQATSSTFITGSLTADKCILLGVGDTRTKMMEQSDVKAASGSTFFLSAPSVSFTDGLAMGGTLHSTRARYLVQADDTADRQVYIGELTLNSAGGTIDLQNTRTHNLARTAIDGTTSSSAITLLTDNFCATQFWMDMLYIARGTVTWTGNEMFGALDTAHKDMFFNQSERAIQISDDAGVTWADLSTSFDPATMPHGFLAEHIGTWDFDGSTFTAAPDAAKSLRVRYWEMDSISSPVVDKPGFQFLASQMDYSTHTRLPTSGDVFRIKNGDQWIDVTYQGGEWRSGGYTRYTGNAANNAVSLAAAISNDFIQINRTLVSITAATTLDGNVFLGPKGAYFLTGDPSLGSNGTDLNNITIQNAVIMSEGTNSVRWDWSKSSPAAALLQQSLIIEAASDFTFADGSGNSLTLGTEGTNNMLIFGPDVTVITSTASALTTPSAGATYVNTSNVTTIAAGARSNFDTFSTPDAEVAQYLPSAFYDATQGRGLLPSASAIWDFDLNAFADADAGFGARAVITAAKSDHNKWDTVIADLQARFHGEPDHYTSIAASAAVDSVVLSGLTSTSFHPRFGGDPDGYFKIVGDELQVARALTGLDQIFVMRGAGDETFVVDVT